MQPAAETEASVNLLPRSDAEAATITRILGRLWFAGVVVKELTDAQATGRTRAWEGAGLRVSVGMGDGDDGQWRRALDVAAATSPAHLNQPWFAAPVAVERLRALGRPTRVNAMVSPGDGGCGLVRLAPGGAPVALRWADIAEGLQTWGVWSVKFFPLGGQAGRGAYARLVRELRDGPGPRVVEPSGGVTPSDLPWLLGEAMDNAIAPIPHVYGAARRSDGSLDPAAIEAIGRHLRARDGS